MALLSDQPTNKNFLSPLGFKFLIKKTPNVNWFIQSVNLPGLSLPSPKLDTPFTSIPLGGDKLIFSDLRLTFQVDEELKNYLEIYNWLIGVGFPEDFDQYQGPGPKLSLLQMNLKKSNIKSDASLIILNSVMNPILQVNFIDLAPIELSEIKFDSRSNDVNYVEASVIFNYLRYTITPI